VTGLRSGSDSGQHAGDLLGYEQPGARKCGPMATARSPSGRCRPASTSITADEIGFTWAGSDEGTKISGAGSAELQEDGSLQIELDYHLGDEALLKAVRVPSSTACELEERCGLEHDSRKADVPP
jgi:hypothetical protein